MRCLPDVYVEDSGSDTDSYVIPLPTSKHRRAASLWLASSTGEPYNPESLKPHLTGDNERTDSPQNIQDKEISSTTKPISVLKTNNTKKRKWDKKHYCVYCMKKFAKLPRHFEQVHESEVEVAKALSYKKGSKIRKRQFDLLRNKGNHSHNIDVLKTGTGSLIPARRCAYDVSHQDLLPCDVCFGYFIRRDLWKHKKNCTMNADANKKPERHHQAKSSLLLPVSSEASDSFKDKVFGVMHCDDVSFAARRDNVIVKFGERMFAKLGNEKHHISHVSQKMRELGRLLLKVRETDPDIVSLQECIHPKQFDIVLEAVRSLAGFDPHTGRYKTPSLAIKLGQSLQKCALIIKADCIRMEDLVSEAQAEKFSELASIEWNHKVSSGARTSLYERKFNKPNMLPLSEDILKIQSKLSEVMEENKKLLISGENKVAWKTLAEVTLSKLILFNRRRSGEVQRIQEVDFTKRRHCSSNSDVMDSLSQWEQTLCNKMERVEIKGKRGRKVPILLTKEMVEAMELLHSTRQGSGVSKENPYFFARVNNNSKEPLRGSDCLRKYALLADTKYPASLTSTKLRKQIATVSQIVSLKDNELDVLAGFLGHDIRTHREYYRLPEDTLQMAKVARLLLVMEKGTVGSFKDKTLEEIEIPLDGK